MRALIVFAALACTGCGGPKIGAACARQTDCGGANALCLTASGAYPGGYCSDLCVKDSDCGGGAFCETSTGDGLCVASCHADGDCRTSEGYRCVALPLDGGSRTACSTPFPQADGGTDGGP